MSLLAPQVLSVDRLTAYLRAVIEEDPILADVWVRGEVTNFHRSAAGHCYFSLGNDGTQLRCVLFRNSQRGLLAMPQNGDEVLAHGRVSIYEGTGQYQLYVDNIAPEGTGVLQLQFEEMRKRLEADGLFALDRKRPLPERPACIGVVTSAQGAVWHDICTVITRRFPLTTLVFAPAAVQGINAPGELIRSLQALQQHSAVEVIIVGRGGGSAEDLACFNDEQLARAIYASRVPVVSAVGHETDVSIADLVADVRAATPSAAAELCVPDRRDLIAAIGRRQNDALDAVTHALNRARHDLKLLSSTLTRCSPEAKLATRRQDLDMLAQKRSTLMSKRIASHRTVVTSQRSTARLLDPRDVLRRGYAIVTTPGTTPEARISSATSARSESLLRVAFNDGSITARVSQEDI